MRIPSVALAVLLLLSSCSSPPKLPTAGEADRRPANGATALSLQSCESELVNTRIAHRESARAAEAAKAMVVRLASQQHALTTQALRVDDRRNTVYTVLFGFGDSHVAISESEGALLVDAAKAAALIALRGRTDGSVATSAESRIARERSEAVRDYLIQAGVDPARIRTTWQPVGDNAADNARDGGRRLNRRVEIELYRAAPRPASLEPARE